MIHIVEGPGTPADQSLLESMFEDRKRLFIDLLDWDLTVVDDRLEVDRFDDAYATYIIAADRAGRRLDAQIDAARGIRSEEQTTELQSLMPHSSAVFFLKKKTSTMC